ncbi:MAG: iron-sulfur cluster assembly accessory protein [Chloroflexota bacterium]|nr:iron-sulfur cluster assembly accessory protein [Chloroflexia bacterium]MDQ3410765.1 iron-sulfur cluster assembly accessory protein [Chloroflexota bacterium]MDQ3692979.1 iron-sulfur cluster assembly accessory protein [Chloroflexota bacterium]
MMTITQEAASQLKSFLVDNGSPEAGLRVFVAPGGCSGLQYGMTIEDNGEDGDEVIETDGVRLFVDNFSAMYLAGSEVDYVNSLMGGGFTVHNPNAVSGCACGHSFNSGANETTANGCGCG